MRDLSFILLVVGVLLTDIVVLIILAIQRKELLRIERRLKERETWERKLDSVGIIVITVDVRIADTQYKYGYIQSILMTLILSVLTVKPRQT